MHTRPSNDNNVITLYLLHVSALTGPSSGNAQLHVTIVNYCAKTLIIKFNVLLTVYRDISV